MDQAYSTPSNGHGVKRPFEAVSPPSGSIVASASASVSSPSNTSSSLLLTADTSAVPTPLPLEAGPTVPDSLAERHQKFVKKLKLKFGATKQQQANEQEHATNEDRVELGRRSDQFLRAHASVYQALLPEKNHVTTLLEQSAPGTVHREAVPYRQLSQPETIKGGTMKAYQLTGLSFLAYMFENGQNCILADEMGLGKTLQTLSLLAYLYETHGFKGPHLLVCPLSVLGAWMTEIARWLPTFKSLRFHGPMSERGRLKHDVTALQPDLIVTTYEAYTAEAGWFKHRRWGVCVLDEGHKIKNHESNAAQALFGIGAQMRLILSGTPLQNNLIELWSLLHFLAPQVFTSTTLKPFKEAFNLTQGLYDQSFLKKSQKLLELIMLRRTKEGVRTELSVPRREEMTLYVPLSPAQRFWYTRLLTRADTITLNEIFATDLREGQAIRRGRGWAKRPSAAASIVEEEEPEVKAAKIGKIEAAGQEVAGEDEGDAGVRDNIERAMAASKAGEGNAWMKMMNLLMQLRKCCNHPYLLPNAEAEPFEVAEHIVAASSKLVLLDKLLADILPKGEKVLIFSGFTRMLDILEDFMQLRAFKYARLDGSTSRPRRALDIKLFQQHNSPYQVYLVSARAGGLGINLTAATTVVLVDQDWNPQVDIQAISRAHRIGQTKTVQVYRLVCQDSVEEQALTRLRKKLYLSAKVMGSMKNAADRAADEELDGPINEVEKTEDDAPRMTRGELAQILRGGASALARWSSVEGTDAFTEFKSLSFAELRARGKARDEKKEVGIKLEIGETITPEQKAQLEREEEEAERLLLQGKEAVQARKFEGSMYKATNAEIRKEWQETMARSRDSRTVEIDGQMVLKDTIANGQWEAVKTITSDPKSLKKLQNTKRQRKKFDHEDFCMVCKDGGEVYQCASCPRSCHGPCTEYSESDLHAMMSWFCPQHNCTVCHRSTQEAGGLLFRCQLCPNSFCEDCLPPDEIDAVGDVLPEFALLGCGKRSQAFFIRCAECVEHLQTEPQAKAMFEKEQVEVLEKCKAAGIDL
ncbi:BQ2448_6667 [Microbotryum intermedium]|uniref:BQ2448_6667 protein n=1 Tax=Microbotryum intermedium TaxID=269621 RepID=A0A238FM47_9BASI|nr:BQ2448_6667 [Microbotryum intermedium]